MVDQLYIIFTILIFIKNRRLVKFLIGIHFFFGIENNEFMDTVLINIYSQTCIKRSWPLGQNKSGLIRQVTS